MPSKLRENFKKQLKDFFLEYVDFAKKSKYHDLSDNPIENIQNYITRASALVRRIVPSNSEYYLQIRKIQEKAIHEGPRLRNIMGVVSALIQDISKGYIESLSEIIRGDVFSDYLEMAEYLLEERYKDPAAVIAGSTLEVQLRNLCVLNSIDTSITKSGKEIPKKASVMNSDLTKKGVYLKNKQKQIDAWLGIRNSGAHGKYSEYTDEDVRLFIQGLRQFINNYPA